MPRRFPVLALPLAAAVGLVVLIPPAPAQPPAAADDNVQRQEDNLKKYKQFADELLKLAQRWEKSDNPDEKARAKTLRAALDLGTERGVENLFRGLLGGLRGDKSPSGLTDLVAKDRVLVKALEEILDTLETEDEAERLKRERMELERLVELVKQLKREEETLRARTGVPKSDLEKIAKDQAALAKRTEELAKSMAKPDPKTSKVGTPAPKEGGKGPEQEQFSEPKPEGKPGESGGEPKPDTKESKSDGKEGAGEPKAGGESKPSPKDGQPKAGADDKPAPKDGAADPKGGKGMGEPKPADPKDGQPKPSPAGSKAQGDGKAESKPSQGQGGEAKPMPGGQPSDSPPGGGKPKPGGSSGGGKPSGQRPPNPNNPNDDAQRHVEEAVPPQEDAEKDLRKNDREQAGKNEDQAIKKLTDALKELERRLKQLREKEMLKKLEDLERRVAKMLRMQVEVYEATKQIDGLVKRNKGEMTSAERQKSQVQGDNEGLIVEEAFKALRLLEGEGTAVVFAGVLVEARKDMEAVQKQLTLANVGPDTQLVEEQIIEQLKRMLEALKKAKQDLENPPPPPPGQPPPPNDGKKNLIQLVEQLKLLKDLQLQVNTRTTAFGTRTPGEQSADPFIQEQLRQLGDRQKVLQDMLHKVASQLAQQ